MTNQEKIDILWQEVQEWEYGSDGDSDLEYAIRNNFRLWAVYLWISSGASIYNFDVNLKGYKQELKHLIDSCDTFTCSRCNHVGVYDKDQFEVIDSCYGCGNNEPIKKDV